MDWQFIAMLVLFVAAAAYVVSKVYQTIKNKKSGSCSTGCGKCGADFSKIPLPKK